MTTLWPSNEHCQPQNSDICQLVTWDNGFIETKVYEVIVKLTNEVVLAAMHSNLPCAKVGRVSFYRLFGKINLEFAHSTIDLNLDLNAVTFHCRDCYPDNYDILQKMQAKFFSYITPILELARQEEYMAAAEVMKHVATAVLTSMLLCCLLYSS
jgi:hypothetical protein